MPQKFREGRAKSIYWQMEFLRMCRNSQQKQKRKPVQYWTIFQKDKHCMVHQYEVSNTVKLIEVKEQDGGFRGLRGEAVELDQV